MKKFCKYLLLLIPILVFCIFTGCGAKVSTDMTVDKNFAGDRKIILEIDNDDLDEVDGGIKGLEKVIKANIPKEMNYAISNYSGGKKITFKINFTSIKDYRSKVNKIIQAGVTGDEDAKTVEVNYERNESYFKKGILFNENFSSIDLLDWFREGLRKADIISESESNWYETGSTKLTLEGEEYSSISVNTQENTCLNNAVVTTKVLVNNTFERTITFNASEETVQALNEKGCVLKDYMGALAPKDCEFSYVDDSEEDEWIKCVFEFKADTAEDLVEKTNAIMQTKTNSVSLESAVNPDKLGYANVEYSELLDGSFYLNYESYYSTPLSSNLQIYNNTTILDAKKGDADLSYNNNEGDISYSASSTQAATFNMEWQIEFSEIELSVDSKGKDKITLDLNCSLSDDLNDEMKKSAIDRMKSFFASEDEYEATDDNFTFALSGEYSEVSDQLNVILNKALDQDYNSEDGVSYINIQKNEFKTNSILSTASSYSLDFNVTPLFGNTKIKVDESKNVLGCKYYVGDTETNEDGEVFITSNGSFNVYEVKLSIVVAIILVLSGLLFIFGIIFLLCGIKPLKEYIEHKKACKAEAAKIQAAQQAAIQDAQPVEPPVVETPVAETPVSEESVEAPASEEPVAATVQPTVAVAETNTDDEEELI